MKMAMEGERLRAEWRTRRSTATRSRLTPAIVKLADEMGRCLSVGDAMTLDTY